MIPEIAAYGSLYGTEAMRELFSLPAFLRYLAETEAKLARAQATIGLVPDAAAVEIENAVRELFTNVDPEVRAALISGTENVGYPIVPLIEAIKKRVGLDIAKYVHFGATTQDILDTARVVQITNALTLLRFDIWRIVDALAGLSERHRHDVMPGRTHLQHALPITFGYKAAVWLSPLLESLDAYEAVVLRLFRVEFGGAVGTLASLGDRGREAAIAFADALGMRASDAPWHADRSSFAAVCSEVAITCGLIAKIAFDITLLMQTEVSEVFEPHAPGRGSSSTMPQKRNPIACEYVMACTRGVHALMPMMFAALQGDHERSTGPWQSEEIAIPQIFFLASGAVTQMAFVLEGIVVDTNRMRANVDLTQGLIMAESAATALSGALGKTEAHHVVEQACATALKERRSLLDVLAEDEVVAAHLDREALASALRPESALGEADAVVDRVLARHAQHVTARRAGSVATD